jgi:hypothetical protein
LFSYWRLTSDWDCSSATGWFGGSASRTGRVKRCWSRGVARWNQGAPGRGTAELRSNDHRPMRVLADDRRSSRVGRRRAGPLLGVQYGRLDPEGRTCVNRSRVRSLRVDETARDAETDQLLRVRRGTRYFLQTSLVPRNEQRRWTIGRGAESPSSNVIRASGAYTPSRKADPGTPQRRLAGSAGCERGDSNSHALPGTGS